MEKISNSLEETYLVAKEFIKNIKKNKKGAFIVSLYGNLGSGKTTFVKGIANALNVKEEVVSPTFIIERIYKIKEGDFKRLIHIDTYRLEDIDEVLKDNWKDIFSDNQNIVFIEWPEKIENLITENSKKIYFEFIDENKRKIKI